MKIFHTILVFMASCSALALSVTKTLSPCGQSTPHPPRFAIEFPNETSFAGRAADVLSVSKQQYISGPFQVSEIVILMRRGVSQLRIYHAIPIESGKVLEQIENRAPDSLKEPSSRLKSMHDALESTPIIEKAKKDFQETTKIVTVVKDYPFATHAKTLEFIVSDKKEFDELYDALVERFSGRGELICKTCQKAMLEKCFCMMVFKVEK